MIPHGRPPRYVDGCRNYEAPVDVDAALRSLYGFSVQDLREHRRDSEAVQARIAGMLMCRKRLGLSYPAIGRVFSRDHSTVHSVVKAHDPCSCGPGERCSECP